MWRVLQRARDVLLRARLGNDARDVVLISERSRIARRGWWLQRARAPEDRGGDDAEQRDHEPDDPPGDIVRTQNRAEQCADSDDAGGGDDAHEHRLGFVARWR